MEDKHLEGPVGTNFTRQIAIAQATAIAAVVSASVAFNVFIAISAALISYFIHGPLPSVLMWLVATLAILGARLIYLRYMLLGNHIRTQPRAVLRLLTLGAFGSGAGWALLPLFIPGFDGSGRDSCIVLIMVGIAAGSILRGIPYSRVALAFAMPPLLSIVALLVASADASSLVLALNVVGLGFVFYRSSHTAEATFTDNELSTLQATGMAASLQSANSDILDTNSRLEVLANCDPLTGLCNRILFNTRLKAGIADAGSAGSELALLVIDLDRFKSINDSLGHTAGDAVLLEVSLRLSSVIGKSGLVARLGGDEFAVIFSGEDAARNARQAAGSILKRARSPITIPGGTFVIGTSIGLAVYPQHAQTAEGLLASADMALYQAKEKGRRQLQEFNPQLKAQADRQHQIELDLEHAIHTGAVEAWFQPQVMLADRRIIGFEALVRWTHPRLGPISPPEIVLAAQAMHLSDHLTTYMAASACRLLRQLPQAGLPDASVAINVSPREFSIYSLADVLQLVVGEHGINPALLEIEITEEAIVDTTIVGGELKRLEEAGYKLAVDDFGMGHSSLAYLISLKIDRLKIDRSFVEGIAASRHNQALIAALVGIGHTLSIDIIVEGVEQECDVETLRALGCAIGQGYLFARPMPVDRLMVWIDEHHQATPGRAVA